MELALGLLVLCALGSNPSSAFPALWNEAPKSLQNFPVIGGKTSIDPWNYLHRLGMYRVLLEKTQPAVSHMDPSWDQYHNLLWGLPIQHGWQFTTNRLQDFSGNTSCGATPQDTCISPYSWWAAMNYHLSTIPFLGALHAGYFKNFPRDLVVQKPKQLPDKFCTSVTECKAEPQIYDAIIKWSSLFRFLNRSLSFDTNDQNESKEQYVYLLWRAHTASIIGGLPLFRDLLPLLSSSEATFGIAWSVSVRFIAATDFQTNYNNTNKFQELYLPTRLLTGTDLPPFIPDQSGTINKALALLEVLRITNEQSGRRLLEWWQRAMCTRDGRAVGRKLLAEGITNPSVVPGCLARLSWIMLTQSCDRTEPPSTVVM